MYTKNDLIKYLRKIDNIFKYAIKGGASQYNKEHPNTLELINEYTKDMQVFAINKTLIPKLLYLTKYFGIIDNILDDDNSIMIYDRSLRDFKKANINSAKKQWEKIENELKKIDKPYAKQETINLLKNIYPTYFGKSGNRRLMRDNLKLYYSLYYYTKHLDILNQNYRKFTMRLYILCNNVDIFCELHNKTKHWTFDNGEFKITCSECEHKYPSIGWFKEKYGDEWENYRNKRISKLNEIRANSLNWYISKYGSKEGSTLYEKSVENKINNITTLKKNRYSKISQELFWEIYNYLDVKDNIYFHELNQEYVIRIPKKYNHDNTVMVVDFIQNKKIIEYNGKYWHCPKKDVIRKEILEDLGYDVMFVCSDDYNRNNKNHKIIEECVNFIKC